MKKWLASLGCVLFGIGAGLGGAYLVGTLEAMSTGPMMSLGSSRGDAFDRIYDKFAYLGATEQAAADCTGKGDLQGILANESKVVALLQETSAKTSGLAPPIDAAQARLAIRVLVTTENDPQDKSVSLLAERAKGLAVKAGWKNPAEAHLRDIIAALDKDHCEASPLERAAAQ